MMNGYGGTGLWWVWPLVLLAGVVALVWGLVRAASPRGGRGDEARGSAREILRERFARGEISEEELRERLRVLDER